MTTPSVKKVAGVIDDSGKYSDKQIEDLASKSKNDEQVKQIIAWTKNNYQRCRTVRQTVERQWYINMAFYCSRQHVSTMPTSNGSSPTMGVRLYVPPAPYWRSRPIFNRIRPIVRKEMARLTAQKPSATIVPSTSEDRDLYAAQAGEQIWESIYSDKKLKVTFRQAVFWSVVTGNGFLKHYWDPTAKSNYKAAPVAANVGMAAQPEREVPGDICFENVSPFNLFFPDLLAENLEAQPFLIHIQTRTPAWVKLNYKIDIAPDTAEANDILNDSFLNLIGANTGRRDTVLIYEVWIKPNQVEFMPNGGMFTIIGDQLVQRVDTGNPYQHQKYPFTHIPNVPTGRFYADSVVNDLIPIQREYNRTRGQIIENKNTMGMVKLMAAEGSVDPTKINTAPGQAILYKVGFPAPQPIPPVPLPAYVVQEIDRLDQEFEDISGQHEVSNGQTPPGVTAATAISFLQEQDETMLSSMFQSIEEAYENIAGQTLAYVQQYWTVARMIKVSGTNNQFSVLSFKGSDLANNTDIRIEAGSALPTSKAGKQALLMDLMSQGFIPPEKGLELLDIGGVQRLYDQLKIDTSQASRENMKMTAVTEQDLMSYQMSSMNPGIDSLGTAQGLMQESTTQGLPGQPGMPDPNNMPPDMPPEMAMQAMQATTAPPLIVPVNSWDNHQVHIQVHNDYRKSQQFENLSPQQKQLFEDHVNQHLTSMGMMPGATPEAQATAQQQQMQMQMGPVPNGGPPNSGGSGGGPAGPPATMNANNAPPTSGPPPGMGGMM